LFRVTSLVTDEVSSRSFYLTFDRVIAK
jgi:hypothetical protein